MDSKLFQLALESLSGKVEKLEKEHAAMQQEIQLLRRSLAPQTSVEATPKNEDELLTLKGAIELLRISRSSLLRLVNDGIIKPIRFNLRTVRYSRQQLIHLMKNY